MSEDSIGDFLNRFRGLHPKAIDLSLSRMERILKALSNPHHKMPPVIHIAGTNGKGSTLAFIKAVLENHGFKVHRYTSPHLEHWNERIDIQGHRIEDDFFLKCLEHVWKHNAQKALTLFEALTATAFYAFAQKKADVLLLETGLGGRFDATNVIESPLCSIITTIDFDHQEYLGTTLKEIAYQKAGIIKPRCPVITSESLFPDVLDVITAESKVKKSPLSICSNDLQSSVLSKSIKLQGRHQIINASLAAKVCELFFPEISELTFKEGLAKAYWPGRLELIQETYCPVWIDGAHNPSGASVLRDFFLERYGNHSLTTIVGLRKRKDAMAFLKSLSELSHYFFFVPLESESYDDSYHPDELLTLANELNIQSQSYDNLKEAIDTAFSFKNPILITGSLGLIAPTKKIIIKNI